jgi:hypothetical protein
MRDLHKGGGSAVYGLGMIGAAIYFISHATTFWMGVLGFLKALVWPAFLVYQAFEVLAKYLIQSQKIALRAIFC